MGRYRKFKECSYCGNYDHGGIDIIEDPNDADKKICNHCIEFFQTTLPRNHHYLWVIQFALDKLESMIDNGQDKLIDLEAKESMNLPYCSHGLPDDSRRKRINQNQEFLDQYYLIHKWLKQMHKIVRHAEMVQSAEDMIRSFKFKR